MNSTAPAIGGVNPMKSSVARQGDYKESWYFVDAKGLVLGRISSRIALLLQGKENPKFAPYIQPNVHVVIVNAEKIALTGNKRNDKEEELFYYHTGYPGGIRSETYAQTLEGKHPERVVIRAIKRMLPKRSPRARQILKCLHVYAGESHPHTGQSSLMQSVDFSANRKNAIRQFC
jgi:large subunit ribosomal protein L13